jgi:hypothetical protein
MAMDKALRWRTILCCQVKLGVSNSQLAVVLVDKKALDDQPQFG